MGKVTIIILLAIVFGVSGYLFMGSLVKPEPAISKELIIEPTPTTAVVDGDDEMIEDINRVRANHGLRLLVEDNRLNRSAHDKACDMRDNDYFDHVDLKGRHGWHYFHEEGYFYHDAGENLANFSNDLDQAMRMFIASPEHFQVMTNPAYVNIGIGVCGQYVAQHYAD